MAIDAGAQSLAGISDGEVLCDTEVTPVLTLKNAGQDNLTMATIDWEVDNVAQTPYNWTGNLSTNQTEDITFPTQTFAPGAHTLEFMITSANGTTDMNASNDDLDAGFTIVDGDEIEVSILTDDYGDETTWEITDASNAVVASGGGYGDNTQYMDPACLADGCYTFTIFDSYNDGICCGFGIGNYEVLSPSGETMGSGGEFGASESVTFCLPYVPAPPNASFTAPNTDLCAPESITYNNTSTPAGATYAWTFEGGSPGTSAAENPTVNYNTACTYDVELTVTNTSGSDTYTLTDHINVYPTPTATANGTDENLWTGGNNGTATATPSGGTPPYTYSWSPSGGSDATASGLSAGNYTVTVTDDEGCEATANVTIGNNVGVDGPELADAIGLYPNPTSDVLHATFPSESGITEITLTDALGRLVRKINVNGIQQTDIDLNGLAEGVYHLNFLASEKKATRKVVYLRR